MTSGCGNHRFDKLLYAWELGLLDEADREALELHLLECEQCFRRAEEFADTAELLRDSLAVRAAVDSHANDTSPRLGLKSIRIWPGLIRVSLAAAAVLAVLILRPWQFEFKSTQLAVAAANRLAIDHFLKVDQPADPEHLGSMVADLAIANLSESGYLQIVSSQRWNDVTRLYRTEIGSDTTRMSPLEIARRVTARWLVTGSIDESSQAVRLTSQVVDVATGVVASNQAVVGSSGESFFAVVDRLIGEIRADLSIPNELTLDTGRSAAQVTTQSREAYRCYVEGLEYAARHYYREAISAFDSAVFYDSTFAMAYYQLSVLKDRALIARAVQFSPHASWLEQHYIRAAEAESAGRLEEMRDLLLQIIRRFPDEKEAYSKLGQFHWRQDRLDSAIVCFLRTVEIDPAYREAYNHLMYTYSDIGRFDRAVWAIDKYIELAPGEANPYDSRGDLLALHGKPLEATESYLQALRIKPDFSASAIKLILLWMNNREYTRADSLVRVLEQSPVRSMRRSAEYLSILTPIYRGKLSFALSALDSAISRVRKESDSTGSSDEPAGYHELKARIFAEKGMFDQALASLDRAIEINQRSSPDDSVTFRYLYARYLAARGDFAAAGLLRRRLAAHTEATGEAPCYQYWAAGGIELDGNNPTEAIKQLEQSTALTSVATDFTGNFMLARAYLESGSLGKSVTLFEQLIETYSTGRLLDPIGCVKLHYYLGRAYEESRWYDQAAREYRTFLDFWSDADPGLSAVEDARSRLKRLENGS